MSTRLPEARRKRFAPRAVLAAAAALALGAAGCTSDQDVEKTPVGSVISGQTSSPDAYLNSVEQANQNRSQSAPPYRPVGSGTGAY